MSQREQQKPAASTAVQQSDNIAHALAGAGGGILSMVLTYASPRSSPWANNAKIHFTDTL